ncbi:uncharacterized protein LOC113649272 [Tachysurus fulvidraco]|uniref:uncharacterized protein LOC113649272 n=1 Tax=Tachysurus fulvidraco TaxID=1234273 RepID=UPI000F516E3C|nr:uncharacterized protein LOC113649272 [Tachysurus fulvidraco]
MCHNQDTYSVEGGSEFLFSGMPLWDLRYHNNLGAQGICKGSNHSDTDPLLFGKPIKLTVEPKNVQEFVPKLSILSSYGNNEKWDTCLAAAFSPKEGTLSLSLENKKSVKHTVDNAVMSKNGTYYFATFSKDAIETCQMKGISANKGPGQSPDCGMTVVTKSPTVVSDVTNSTEILKPETKTYSGDPKGNTMQLFVTGLRLLLAKAVGVNILMTFKAFLV